MSIHKDVTVDLFKSGQKGPPLGSDRVNVGKTDERKMACTANQDNEGEKTVVI